MDPCSRSRRGRFLCVLLTSSLLGSMLGAAPIHVDPSGRGSSWKQYAASFGTGKPVPFALPLKLDLSPGPVLTAFVSVMEATTLTPAQLAGLAPEAQAELIRESAAGYAELVLAKVAPALTPGSPDAEALQVHQELTALRAISSVLPEASREQVTSQHETLKAVVEQIRENSAKKTIEQGTKEWKKTAGSGPEDAREDDGRSDSLFDRFSRLTKWTGRRDKPGEQTPPPLSKTEPAADSTADKLRAWLVRKKLPGAEGAAKKLLEKYKASPASALSVLAGGEEVLSSLAASALKGQALPEPLQARLREVLSTSPLVHARLNAVEVLVSQNSRLEADRLAAARALGDEDAKVRERARAALGGDLPESVLVLIVRRIGKAAGGEARALIPLVKWQATWPDAALAALRELLYAADREVQERAAEILAKTSEPSEAQLALSARALAHPNPSVRSLSYEALKGRKELPPSALKTLLEHLVGPDAGAGEAALLLLSSQKNLPVTMNQPLLATVRAAELPAARRAAKVLLALENLPSYVRKEVSRLFQEEQEPGRKALLLSMLEEMATRVVVSVEPGEHQALGYALPYALPGLESERTPRRQVLALIRQSGDSPDKEALRAAFEQFDALIEGNFGALSLLARSSRALTKQSALSVLADVGRMVAAFRKIDPEAGPAVVARYARFSRELKQALSALTAREFLPAGLASKMADLERGRPPLEKIQNLHTFINHVHQESFKALEKVTRRAKADGTVTTDSSSFGLINLGAAPLVKDSRVDNELLRLLTGARVPRDGQAIIRDDKLWFHSKLGEHSVSIQVELGDREEGLLRVRYSEGGSDDGNRLRLRYLQRVFEGLGVPVKIEGGSFLDATLDKDHGLNSKEDIARVLPRLLMAIALTPNVDQAFKAIAVSYGTSRAGQLADAMADAVVAEGRVPFYVKVEKVPFSEEVIDTRMWPAYQDWLKDQPRRDKVKAAIARELERLGLPALPSGPFGQHAIKERFTEPVRLAIARGELSFDENGLPQRTQARRVEDLARAIESDEDEALLMAGALGSAELQGLAFETVGAVGRFLAQRVQWLSGGRTGVTVHVLRDPLTQAIAYATADRWDGTKLTRLPPAELAMFLKMRDLGGKLGALPSKTLRAKWRRQLEAQPTPEPLRPEARGLSASAGAGSFVTAKVSFKRESFPPGAIFIAPFTTPDDFEVLRKAGGVVTTGGGLLSHATISTRELGIASVILPTALWKKDASGQPYLEVTSYEAAPAVQGPGGFWVSHEVRPRVHVLTEGTLLRVNGQDGTVTLIAAEKGVSEAHDKLAGLKDGREKVAMIAAWLERQEPEVQYQAGLFILGEALWNRALAAFREELLALVSKSVSGEAEARLREAGARVLTRELARLAQDLAEEAEPDEHALTRFGVRLKDVVSLAKVLEVAPPEVEVFADKLAGLWFGAQERKAAERATALDEALALAAKVDALGVEDLPALRRVLRKTWPGRTPGETRDLAFVCTGNTCRSPIAEYQMKALLQQKKEDGFEVFSRGLEAEGGPISSEAAEVLAKDGIASGKHTARPLSGEDVARADVILAMTRKHLQNLLAQYPGAIDKVFLLKAYARQGAANISDPVGLGPEVYAETAREIQAALLSALEQERALVILHRKEAELAQLKKASVEKLKPSVLPLGALDDDHTSLVGGKSAKLGEVVRLVAREGGYVPEGFAVTTEAYLRFLKEAGIEQRMALELAELDALVARKASGEEIARKTGVIRKLITSAKISADSGVGLEIAAGIKTKGLSRSLFAVRSSAVQEDTAEAAFAGAAETYLNVDAASVLNRVVANWASFWLPRGVLYRAKQGIESTDVRPAVVVQSMADAQVAGVLFTVNPVTGKKQTVINAAYGLGEGIVSGVVQADQYTAENGEESAPPMLGDKRKKIARRDGGGVVEVAVEESRRRARALSPEQVAQLAKIGDALADHFGYPLDIEFAIDSQGRIAILQARAVTAK